MTVSMNQSNVRNSITKRILYKIWALELFTIIWINIVLFNIIANKAHYLIFNCYFVESSPTGTGWINPQQCYLIIFWCHDKKIRHLAPDNTHSCIHWRINTRYTPSDRSATRTHYSLLSGCYHYYHSHDRSKFNVYGLM